MPAIVYSILEQSVCADYSKVAGLRLQGHCFVPVIPSPTRQIHNRHRPTYLQSPHRRSQCSHGITQLAQYRILGAHICSEIWLVPQNMEHRWCASVQRGTTTFQPLHQGRHFDHHELNGQVRFKMPNHANNVLVTMTSC